MAFPADVLSTDSFLTWRTRFNTVKNAVVEKIEHATLAPTAANYDYPLGSLWIKINTDQVYVLADNTVSTAVWTELGAASTIVGITGTMAEFDTALTDGNFAYAGGAFHDGFSDTVAAAHINWTNASDNFLTTGTVKGGTIYAGNPTLTTDDQFYLGAAVGTVPVITFDASDQLSYNRTSNQFDFVIGAVEEFTLNATDADFQSNNILTTGDGNIGGTLYVGNTALTTDDFFSLSAISATAPRITFDSTDFVQYDRTANTFSFTITNVEEFNLSATLADFKSNNLLTSGYIRSTGAVYAANANLTTQDRFYLSASSVTIPSIVFDLTDSFQYNRTSNEFGMYMGGANEYLFSPTRLDMGNNNLLTTGTLACGLLTSSGINDDATGERLLIEDNEITVGTTGADNVYSIAKPDALGYLALTGGAPGRTSSGVEFYGSGHTTSAYDIIFFSNSTVPLKYDKTAQTWDFFTNSIQADTINASSAGPITIEGVAIENNVVGALNLDVMYSGYSKIADYNSAANLDIACHGNLGTETPGIRLYKARGDAETPTQITAGDELGEIEWYGRHASNWALAASIYVESNSNTGFFTPDFVIKTDDTERLRFVDSTNTWDFGNAGIEANAGSFWGIESRTQDSFYRDISTSYLRMWGGLISGGNLILYGSTHATLPSHITFGSSTGTCLHFYPATESWDFITNSILLEEKAAAETNIATKGQLWVKTATPNLLYFSDDAGTDFQLGQESLWDEQNTSTTAVLGGRYVKTSGASHTITLPVGTGHDVIPNYVMVWNNDTDTSTLTLDPNGTNSITMQGASLGAGVAVVLQPGEAFMVSGRQAGPGWDGRYLTNRSFAANTVSVNNTSSESFPTDTKISGLTEEATPVAGDWLLGEESGGALRKFDVGNIGGGGGITWQLQATSTTLAVGNGYYFAGAAAQVFTLPATFSQGDAPIYITNIDTADSVSVIPTTGDGLYLGNQSLAATSNAFDLNIGDSIMLIPRTSNATWLLVPLHVQGGLQPVVNLGTATTTEQIDIGECENYYVAIGADNVTLDINTVREHGQGYYAKKGQCWVHMNAAYTGLNVTTDNGTTNTINQGTPPSASGDDAILAWHYTRYNATEYLWVEWISML